ncbi:MAG: VWA domain-containing protein, partial [Anaerolineae bacterium]
MKRIKSIFRFHHSRRRGCRGCRTGCFLLFLLLAALICGVIFLFLPQTARAAPALQTDSLPPTHVFLLIDNSNSMFEKGGIGSDPALLRIDAARLFLAYLGVDEPDTPHQAGVIFFGSQAKTAVPLTLLTTDQQRAQLFAQIADPPRLGWTDHLAALELAQSQLSASPRTAIILLTDGKPEWANAPTKTEQTAYVSALQTKSAELAQAGIPLFIILLANQATDGDPDIAAIWQPLWRQMSAATPPGRFFIARAAADLPGIYHDIVVALTGNETVGIILNTAVPDNGSQTTIHIPPNLARLTLVISKTDPAQTITLTAGDGRPLADSGVTIRRAGGDGRTREEVWVIEQPPPGEWTLHVEGLGRVTIWQDIKPGPTPTPASAPSSTPAPTAVPQPTLTARPTVTAAITPSPPPKLTPTPRPTATPSIAAFVPAAPVRPVEATPPQPRWPWLLTGAAGLGLASGGLYWRCRP